MTRTERELHAGMARAWPGAEEHAVVIYRALAAQGRGSRLEAVIRLRIAARIEAERLLQVNVLASRLEAPTRPAGPKRERYDAAIAAIEALRAMLEAP